MTNTKNELHYARGVAIPGVCIFLALAGFVPTGPALAPGERDKLKDHKSGPSSARAFTVDKMLKDMGVCP